LLFFPAVALLILILVRLFALAILRLDFEKRWYVVTDRSLRIREGVVTIREMTVNFANIQNVSISQGPIQRLLGIADLQVETAGGGGSGPEHQGSGNLHTARFRGIDNANDVRELIQIRLRRLKDTGLGDHEDTLTSSSSENFFARPEVCDLLRQILAETVALRATF
jgi:uncharacterized membrane protein YdbT with pleckstrin-like domain